MHFDKVGRREFIAVIGGAAAWPLSVRAQSPAKAYRVGFLGVFSHAEYQSLVDAMRGRLRQLGYEEGKNLIIEYRWADGRYDQLPRLAGELVQINVDVIVTHSTPGALAVKQATSTVPIVVAAVGDPIDIGLVPSLARPGANLTGLTFFYAEVGAKRVELLKEAIPALSRVAVFVNPANRGNWRALELVKRATSALSVRLVPIEVKERDDIAAAVGMAAERAQGLLVIEEPLFISNVRHVADLALRHRLPMIGFRPYGQAGALLEYGADLVDLYSRSALLVDKILKGTPPADLPIERAVKFELVINLKSAKTLGIELPATLLARADEVIE